MAGPDDPDRMVPNPVRKPRPPGPGDLGPNQRHSRFEEAWPDRQADASQYLPPCEPRYLLRN
jgi:hypothetical protein